MGITLIFKTKPRLPYGSGSKGKFIPPEKGRRAIFVPSYGTMEKEEVEYIVGTAQEQEDERIKRGYKSEQKERLEQVVGAVRQAPQGKRAKLAREIIKEGGNSK